MALQTTSFGPFMGSNETGNLQIDGCDALDLAREHGTPLWVVSERTIRHNYQTLLRAFRSEYEQSRLVYASKANPEPAVVRIAWQEGALVDVVTMGHIELALAAGVPPSALVFNGNSKTLEELRWAARARDGLRERRLARGDRGACRLGRRRRARRSRVRSPRA